MIYQDLTRLSLEKATNFSRVSSVSQGPSGGLDRTTHWWRDRATGGRKIHDRPMGVAHGKDPIDGGTLW